VFDLWHFGSEITFIGQLSPICLRPTTTPRGRIAAKPLAKGSGAIGQRSQAQLKRNRAPLKRNRAKFDETVVYRPVEQNKRPELCCRLDLRVVNILCVPQLYRFGSKLAQNGQLSRLDFGGSTLRVDDDRLLLFSGVAIW
jgi:hypothetical protein